MCSKRLSKAFQNVKISELQGAPPPGPPPGRCPWTPRCYMLRLLVTVFSGFIVLPMILAWLRAWNERVIFISVYYCTQGPKEEQLHVEVGPPWLNKVESESESVTLFEDHEMFFYFHNVKYCIQMYL